MYNIIAAQENIFYIKNCISYPNKYVELIENLNNQEESYKYIPEWKLWTASNDLKTIYGIKKQININNVIENLKMTLPKSIFEDVVIQDLFNQSKKRRH